MGFLLLERGTGNLVCLWAYAAWWQANAAQWSVTPSACLITPRHIPEGSLSPHSGFGYARCFSVSLPFLFFSFSPLSRMLSNRSESTQIRLHSRCYWMLTTWFGSAHCVDLECYMGWVWRRHKVRMSKAEGERGRRGRKKHGRTFKKMKAQEMENWRTKVFYNWTKSLWDIRSTPTEDPHDHNCSSSELDNVSIKNI